MAVLKNKFGDRNSHQNGHQDTILFMAWQWICITMAKTWTMRANNFLKGIFDLFFSDVLVVSNENRCYWNWWHFLKDGSHFLVNFMCFSKISEKENKSIRSIDMLLLICLSKSQESYSTTFIEYAKADLRMWKDNLAEQATYSFIPQQLRQSAISTRSWHFSQNTSELAAEIDRWAHKVSTTVQYTVTVVES